MDLYGQVPAGDRVQPSRGLTVLGGADTIAVPLTTGWVLST
jgi:hypothetical protein